MAGNDHWTLSLEDLGMKGAGEELARLILTCQPPYAICVQGKWGSGKTSLMRYAMARLGGEPLGTTLKTSKDPIQELPDWLDGTWKRIVTDADSFTQRSLASQLTDPRKLTASHEPRIVPIWFNPWQHQDAEMPLVALLQELRTQFTFLVQFGRFANKLAQVGVEAGLTILGDLVDTFSLLQGVPKGLGQSGLQALRIAREHQRRDFEELHDAQRLNLMFEQAVQRLLSPAGSGKEDLLIARDGCGLALRRLVIFIDDLDRCSEQQTVRLLEAIKLYLQTRYCVFVVGMDGAAARRAVCNILPHKSQEEAHEYLEKLFQTTLHVPVPVQNQRFLEGLLETAGFQTGEINVEEVARQIGRLVEPNPRKLKNFVSTLAVSWSLTRGATDDFLLFLLLTFLRTYHPAVYRLLSYDPQLVVKLNQALSEKGPLPGDASPEFLFFRQAFRHAFEFAFLEGEAPNRQTGDAIAAELIQRLDRQKGDRAFLELWKSYKDLTDDEWVGRITAILHPSWQGV